MPELSALHERLAALAGEWEGTEELAPSPWSPGKMLVEAAYTRRRDPHVTPPPQLDADRPG